VLVPSAGGDVVVSLVYDARSHKSSWWIFDAARIAGGPIARAHLEHHVPLGFHGTWRPRDA
jgi:all-trans-8'-apo-beta-carotenal 15,15'-oxygenase